jgi:chromosome segregation ATPase
LANNRFTIEVEETGTGRTKQQIVQMLEETKAKASEASRALNQLKADSIKHAEAVSVQASASRQLGIVRAREIQSLKDLQQAGVPYNEGLRAASNTLREYQRRLAETTKEKNKLQGTFNADANRLLQLKVQEKNYSDVVKVAKDEVQRYKQSLSELSEKKQQHIQNARNLSSQIVTERAALSQATDAQQANNRAKQAAQQTYNKLEGNVKTLNRELKTLTSQERAAERETRRMDEATLALANTLGYAAYNAIRNFIEQVKDFIVNATIYASRTDEMRLAMLNMSKQSGVSRGELLLQA